MLLQNRVNAINVQINAYLEEIAALQAKVTSLQAHAQEVQGAEQAALSALAQIDNAIAMLSAICPEEIAVFKAAIDAKFREPLPQLRSVDDVELADEVSPQPVDPVEPETIEAHATVVEESDTQEPIVTDFSSEQNVAETPGTTEQPSDPSDGNGHQNGNGHHLLTYDELRLIDRPTLMKLATQHELGNCKSKKRDELAGMLDGMVTPGELAAAQNGRH